MEKVNKAGTDGLILAAITIICGIISSLIAQNAAISIVIWVIKLIATNYFLYYAMKKFSEFLVQKKGSSSYKENFGYGTLVSFLSNIIIAVYSYINIEFLTSKETLEEAINTAKESMAAQAGEFYQNYEFFMEHYSILTAIGVIVFYTIWGVIISAIFASSTKKNTNPFGGDIANFQ